MKKLLSLILAMTIVMSAFMGLGFSVAAETTDALAITVNGVTTSVPVGEKFTYTYTLSDVEIMNAEATINYDSSKLQVTTVDEDDDDAYEAYLEQVFPVVFESVICNTDPVNRILYNFSKVKGYKFNDADVLATFEFTVLEAGETTITTTMYEMVDINEQYYVRKVNSQPVHERDFTFGEFITYEAPEEPSSEEPSSEEPSSEEPSEEPSSEEPSSEEPSSEEPSSEEPSEEPSSEEPSSEEPSSEEPSSEEPEVKNVIYFDANSANWGEFKKVFCHVWVYGGDAFYSWQAKKETCTDADGDGIWEYNFDDKGIALEDGVLYAVIFSNENGSQTYNLLFDTTCLEDTAYVVENVYENPEDSSKTCKVAFWKNQDPAVFGPEMVITSLGNVIGTCVPTTTTAQGILEAWLANAAKIDNVRTYTGKTDQQIIDDIAEGLGLTAAEAADAIANTEAVVDWNEEDSLIGYEPVIGDVNGDGDVTVLDATLVQRAVAKTSPLDETQAACADVNGDGDVTVLDATIIQRFVAKIITEF